jgi:cytochrome c5
VSLDHRFATAHDNVLINATDSAQRQSQAMTLVSTDSFGPCPRREPHGSSNRDFFSHRGRMRIRPIDGLANRSPDVAKMEIDIVDPHLHRHVPRGRTYRSQTWLLPIEIWLGEQPVSCACGSLDLIDDQDRGPTASCRHTEAGDLIERRALSHPVRGRIGLIELMHEYPFDMPEMTQDVLDRPAHTRRRAVPIVRCQRRDQFVHRGPVLQGGGDQIHEFMLRTRFLASLRMPRSLIVICLLALTACTGAPRPDATGQEIYEQVCSNCHGADLSGGIGPAVGPGSNAAAQDDDFLLLTITRGRGRMPSFDTTLSDDQIARVVDYLRTAQGSDETG